MTRSAAELGAGLAPARPSRAIRPGERIHILGIAGAGASAAALHAQAAGAIVTGCDPGGPSPYTAALETARIPIEWAHSPAHVGVKPPPDRLAVTKALTAINPEHPELLAAARAGIPVEPWQQLIADAAHGRRLIAVAGTHGKSTTAGWLTWVLGELGLDPSAFVGALLPSAITGAGPATARIGAGDRFIVEADEYAGNFDPYVPDAVALTTVEWDHPDVFADRAAVIEAFAAWIERAPAADISANVDDAGVDALLERLQAGRAHHGAVVGTTVAGADRLRGRDGGTTPIGLDGTLRARLLERASESTLLTIEGLEAQPQPVRLPTTGDHNASNALVVLATAARELAFDGAPGTSRGATIDRLLWALSTFPGIGRRLERKGDARGVVVYDDYGHHPTAIRATLAALRQREPGRRVWAVYEPLTYHRTAAMFDDFADALAEADAVAVADIWASRDPDTSITSATALAAATRKRREGLVAMAPGSVEETAAWLADNVRDGDVVLVMGGGRSYRIGEVLLEALEGR